jgi:hypothetical protein
MTATTTSTTTTETVTKMTFQSGRFWATGLMFANVPYLARVSLLKLQLSRAVSHALIRNKLFK